MTTMIRRLGTTGLVTRGRIAGAALLLALAGSGCSVERGAQAESRDVSSLLTAKADTGLELRIILGRDTVSAREKTPLQVFYFVVNGPSLIEFDNDPDRYVFQLQEQDGSPVEPSSASSPVLSSHGDRVRLVLPAGGLLGQVQDLRCIVQGHYVAEPITPPTCLAEYSLSEPGTYRVIVEYMGRGQFNLDSLTALSDSGKLEYP